jgi:hypothetical protein
MDMDPPKWAINVEYRYMKLNTTLAVLSMARVIT